MAERYSYTGRLKSELDEDPDEFCYDSTFKRRFRKVDEIDLDNTGSASDLIGNMYMDSRKVPTRFKSNIGKTPIKLTQDVGEHLKGMVYPKNSSSSESGTSSNMNTQMDYIKRETNYTGVKSAFIKHYEVLRWHFEGYPTKGCVLQLNVDEIIRQYGVNRAMIRDIIPVSGCNSMVGFTAHVDCLTYPHLNNRSSTSNLSQKRCKHFVSISPGSIIEKYEGVKKRDILKICKPEAIDLLLKYVDDNERHPFKELMEQYNQYYTRSKDKIKKHYTKFPTSGEAYLQELIDCSKRVPLEEITKMGEKEWINKSFVTPLNDRSKTYYTLYNPEKSKYVQFASRCPFYEGVNELRYFNKPYGKHAKISLSRHKEVLKLLKVLKTTHGVIKSIPFVLTAEGKHMKTYNRHTPGCVTLRICVKINMK